MRGREPFLLGIIGAVLGIGLAVLVFGGGFGGAATASGSPALPGASASPGPSLVAVASGLATPGLTEAPATTVPATDAPTSAPTTQPTKTPKPTPTPNTAPVIVSWDTPKYEDCTNDSAGSILVGWSVKRADGVTISIDGPGIFDSYDELVRESLILPYGCDHNVLKHTYTLTTVGGTGAAATITKTVRTRPPEILAFGLTPVTGCAGESGAATVRFSYSIRAATGVTLYADGAIYNPYTGKEEGPIPIAYPCSKEKIAFELETSGGYGPPDSKTIVMERPTEP